MRRITTAVAAAAVAAVAVTGCSQVAQLRPVAGDSLASLRTTTIDTVLAAGDTFKSAPVCTADGTDLSCEGLTTDGVAVLSKGQMTATTEIPSEFADQVPGWAKDTDTFLVAEVTVGSDVLFKGLAIEVLDENGRTQQ
ncbi:MAG: hypothetical protein H6525_01115 [Actinobacteria bacterium]|nr:hypothetical protein [Actinomycetota bacterium]MCB9411443.1 hypothetical protein [Actinomycetota bacterium]